MRRIKILFLLVIALTAVSLPAEAHGGRGRVSVGVAVGPIWYPGWYPGYYPAYYPPYYYPQVVTAQPTEYIERGDVAAEEPRGSQGYWYYCKESKTYHPYVKHCPGGWEKQVPTPPPGG